MSEKLTPKLAAEFAALPYRFIKNKPTSNYRASSILKEQFELDLH